MKITSFNFERPKRMNEIRDYEGPTYHCAEEIDQLTFGSPSEIDADALTK